MTITVVRGLLGKPVTQESTPSPQSSDLHTATQVGQQALVARTAASDAVVNNVRSHTREAKGTERINTYRDAKETSEGVRDTIRDNPDTAVEAHRGLNPDESRDAFV